MPLAGDGLILSMLLSVEQGPNNFPNIEFLQNNSWVQAQAVSDDQAFGQGLFKKVDEASYVTAQKKAKAAVPKDIRADAYVLTRSVERLTTTSAGGPWDGGYPHPSLAQLKAWVAAIKASGE